MKRMSLKDSLKAASEQVAKSPEWLKIIYKRNDEWLKIMYERKFDPWKR